MCFGRRVQAIDRISRKGDGRVEPEAVGRANDVVVDGLRNADDGDTAFAEFVRDRQRAVAADHDERAEAHLVEHLDDAIGIVAGAFRRRHRIGERIAGVARAQHRAAEAEDAGDIARRQHARAIGLDQAVEAVFETDAFDARVPRGFDDGADDGVEARRVTAAGEHADAFDGGHACRL